MLINNCFNREITEQVNSASGSDERGAILQLASTSHSTGKIIMGLQVLPLREKLVLFCSSKSSLGRIKPISGQIINWGRYIIIIFHFITMGQLKRIDARTYIHERWASGTWPANMFKLYICTH